MPRLKETPEDRFSTLIRHKMLDKGWNQERLAKVCGISIGTVSGILRSPKKHGYGTICAVAQKLGIDEIPVI